MRVSRTVLREAEGVTPSAYSPIRFVARVRGQRADAGVALRFRSSHIWTHSYLQT